VPTTSQQLIDLGQRYGTLSTVAPTAAPSALDAQRKALRELDANRAGTGRRY
jgi:hypothetical protein